METPFTTEQFFEVFEKYNASVFPAQIIFIGLGIAAMVYLHKSGKSGNSFITAFLASLWLWIGIVYHFGFFTSINKAAYGFGILFLLQGLFFVRELFKKRLEFGFKSNIQSRLGYIFIVFGLLLYPVIGYLLSGDLDTIISLGLPCPTTILTFGFLILADSHFPKYLLIIPTLWAIIGTFAAVNFGVYQDFVMPVAALIANVYLLKKIRYAKPDLSH